MAREKIDKTSTRPGSRTSSKSARGKLSSPVRAAATLFALSALLVILSVLSILGYKLGSSPTVLWIPLIPIFSYLLGFTLILLGFRFCKWSGDPALFGMVTLLGGIGLVIQYRLGSFTDEAHEILPLLTLPLALLSFTLGWGLTAKQHGKRLAGCGWAAYIAALGLMGIMLIFGRRFRGGIYLPGNINPSELVKPLLVLFLATFLTRYRKAFSETRLGIPTPPLREMALLGLFWSIPVVLSFLLHDLGLLALLNMTLIFMLFATGKRGGYLALGVGAVSLAGYFIPYISSHAKARFDVWLDPFTDPTGKGWQILQALSAMYSGGLWGSGLAVGAPQTIPIASSDFVYAAFAEELGLAGCLLLLTAFLILFSRSLKSSAAAESPYERLLGVGLTAALAIQTLLNIAGVTKALPMTGIPLPFISHGGSSLVSTFLIAGLLVGLSDRNPGGRK